MKLILIDDEKGGDSFVRIFNVTEIWMDEEAPMMGFYAKKEIEQRLSARVIDFKTVPLSRKRNIMKHITKLFGRKKRGNTNAG